MWPPPEKKEGRHEAALPTNGVVTPVGRDYSSRVA